MKRDYIILIAGLGSSVCPWRYSKWAREIKKGVLKNPRIRPEPIIRIVSSDGDGEKPAQDEVKRAYATGRLGKLIIGGHSNGFRDALRTSQMFWPEIAIDYLFGIDMTLGAFGAELYGNVAVFDEFWAGLQKADFHESFQGKDRFFDLDKMAGRNVGHVEAASHPIVQQRVLGMIEAELSA